MITLRKMAASEFNEYLSSAVVNYAMEHTQAGAWTKGEALDKSKQQYTQLLPNGVESENNYLYTVMDDEEPVGMIWLKQESEQEGFIYDIYIWEQHQGKGFGKQALELVEEEGRRLGIGKIGLHVFGHNQKARKLYEKLGYETTNVIMSKDIKSSRKEKTQ